MTEISIIMPCHNGESHIEDALTSVIDQTHQDWKLLVVDDASDDSSTQIIRTIARQDTRILLIERPIRGGPAQARNDALRLAPNRFVAFLDSDDTWQPDKLNRQLSWMLDESLAFTFTAFWVGNATLTRKTRIIDQHCPKALSYDDMLRKRATLGCSTVMIDRQQTGPVLMPDMPSGQDYATWLNILKSGATARCLATPLTTYRVRPGSVSRNKFKKMSRQWSIYRKQEKLSFIDSMNYFSQYAYHAIYRS